MSGRQWLVLSLPLTLMASLATSLLTPLPTTGSAAGASTAPYQVFVGYADTRSGSAAPAGDFPTPWAGSPEAIYEGCTTCAHLDGGAVEVVNQSGGAETINSVTVGFGPLCVFDIWPHDISLPPRNQLVLTETAIKGKRGCDNTTGAMDSSDIGYNGADWDEVCHPSGLVPTVTVTEDGTATTYDDTGLVLNTGGYDRIYCTPGLDNESQPWTPIGQTTCPPTTLTAPRSTVAGGPGTKLTLTATLHSGCGLPLAGAAITFDITSGPDMGDTASTTTNGLGQADFTFTGAGNGVDLVSASTTNPEGSITSGPLAVKWEQANLALTSSSGLPGSTMDFHGSGYAPGETVDVFANSAAGALLSTAVATASGTVSGSFVVPDPSATSGPLVNLVGVGQTSTSQGWVPVTTECTDDWIDSTGGDWETASGWSTGSVPGIDDVACVIHPGTYTVDAASSPSVAGLVVGTSSTNPVGIQTVRVRSGSTPEILTATTASIGTHGAITVNSVSPAQYSGLAGTVLTNAGTLTVAGGSGELRYLRTSIINQAGGVIAILAPTRFDQPDSITNSGAFSIGAQGRFEAGTGSLFAQAAGTLVNGGAMELDKGTFYQTGGVDSGNPVVLQASTLADGAGGASFVLECRDTLLGSIPFGGLVTVQADSCGAAATRLEGNFVNDGTLVVESIKAPHPAVLTELNGSLTNEPDGVVTVGQGGSVVDKYTFDTNSGDWMIADGSTVSLDSTSTFAQAASGTLGVAIDGATSTGPLITGGSLTLAGTLSVATTGSVVTGTTFPLITTPQTVAGTFAAVVSPGQPYTVEYGPTSVTLEAG